jgi:hypothetical protein
MNIPFEQSLTSNSLVLTLYYALIGYLLKRCVDRLDVWLNNSKKIKKLEELQKHIKDNTVLNNQIQQQIEDLIFSEVTGLPPSVNNKEFLNLFNRFKSKINWTDFKLLKEYIKNYTNAEAIQNKKIVNLELKIYMLLAIIILGGSGCLYFVFTYTDLHSVFSIVTLLTSYFLLGVLEYQFLIYRRRWKTIKEYNTILKISRPSNDD